MGEFPLLICAVGLPRSGKTTWAQRCDCPIVNPDSIRFALHGQRYLVLAEPFVWAIAKVMVRALFIAGHGVVILDATNTTHKRRDEWLSDRWQTQFHLIRASGSLCIARARDEDDLDIIPIIDKMTRQWEALEKHEEVTDFPVAWDQSRSPYGWTPNRPTPVAFA